MKNSTSPKHTTSKPGEADVSLGTAAVPVRPFLRWAGSKRQQLTRLTRYWSPERHHRYIEPFVGSGCVFFHILPKKAIIGDSNEELINLFRHVKKSPELIYQRLCDIERTKEIYYFWRSLNPECLDDTTRAVRFLYLNRNCFNGIYRTNQSGKFNVPIGRKLGTYFSVNDIVKCSLALQRARLVHGDFEDTLLEVRAKDFIYLDPPYAVTSRRVFREYGREVFNPSDLDRFSKQLKRIDSVGAEFLVSYADCSEARALAKFWKSERVPVRRHIAGFAHARRGAYEWLITNIQSLSPEPTGPSS